MSAIAGLFRMDGERVEHGTISRMLESMAHRGPDGRSQWWSGEKGLTTKHIRSGRMARPLRSPAHKEAFKRLTDDAALRLGYESDRNW